MTKDELSPVSVDLGPDSDVHQRESVEIGIAALRSRAEEQHSVREATDVALAAAAPPPPEGQLPLAMAEGDPSVLAADEAALREQQVFLNSTVMDYPEGAASHSALPAEGGAAPSAEAGGSPSAFVIPYHYAWRWHVGSSPSLHDGHLPSGRIRVSVGGNRRCDAHAGFGVGVRATYDHWIIARSLRQSSEWCRVWSMSTGAIALAEGGMEMTVMEGPTLLGLTQDKRFRRRVNPGFWAGPETAVHDSGGFGTGASIQVRWFARAGHTYQVNVGAWVLAQWREGPHASGPVASAYGNIVGNVYAITLAHG